METVYRDRTYVFQAAGGLSNTAAQTANNIIMSAVDNATIGTNHIVTLDDDVTITSLFASVVPVFTLAQTGTGVQCSGNTEAGATFELHAVPGPSYTYADLASSNALAKWSTGLVIPVRIDVPRGTRLGIVCRDWIIDNNNAALNDIGSLWYAAGFVAAPR